MLLRLPRSLVSLSTEHPRPLFAEFPSECALDKIVCHPEPLFVSAMSSVPWPEARSGNQAFTNAAVVIIGAGLSGMCVAINLLKRGIKNFVIVEKSAGVGGTWRDNKYPGCACDGESGIF